MSLIPAAPFSLHQTIEHFHQARLVRIAHRRFAIWLDPLGVLNPKVVVNLVPELRVTIDLMTQRRWLGDRFVRGGEWFTRLGSSVSALPSKTDEFHRRLSIPVFIGTSDRRLTSDGLQEYG
jgi:hypothetical protein